MFHPAPMGSKRLDSLADYYRHGLHLTVECRACGRVVIVDPLPILQLCHSKAWSKDMAFVATRLRCQRCGEKDVKLGPAFAP